MTKMRETKIDVVRFNESDVIVASGKGPSYMKLRGMGDGSTGNAYYDFNGTSYALNGELGSFITAFNTAKGTAHINENSQLIIFPVEGQTSTSLDSLSKWDGESILGYDVNTTYDWDFSQRVFLPRGINQ